MAAAIALYPGGTWADPAAPGHDFARNFLCDLGAPVAPSGAPNPAGAKLLSAAIFALVVGIAFFWRLVARLVASRPRSAARVRVLGALSILGMVAVPLAPSSRVGAWHAAAIFSAALPALGAGAVAALALAASGRRALALLGGAAIATSAVDGLLYLQHLAAGGPPPLLLPALQRLATALVLAWMIAVALAARRARP